jgi:hypothetical protein
MGYHFRKQSDLDPFVIDHGRTVLFPGMSRQPALKQWLEEIAPTLISIGGTAGFLSNEAPSWLDVLERWMSCSIALFLAFANNEPCTADAPPRMKLSLPSP